MSNISLLIDVSCNSSALQTFTKCDHGDFLAHSVGITVFLLIDISITTPWAILANSIVIVNFFRDPKLRTVQNYYIVSLAVSDWMMGAFVLPLGLYNFLYDGWPIRSRLLCRFWIFMDFTNSLQSSLSVALITYDRYMMVCNPIFYRSRETPRRASLRIIMTWTFSVILYGGVTFLWDTIKGYSDIPLNQCFPAFSKNLWATGPQAFIEFVIPLTVICYCNIRIWVYVRKRHEKTVQTASRTASFRYSVENPNVEKPALEKRQEERKVALLEFIREQKAARSLLIHIGIYFSFWIWYEIIGNFVKPICGGCVSFALFAASYWPQYHLCAINPVIYAITIERFRFHFATFFRRIFLCCVVERADVDRGSISLTADRSDSSQKLRPPN